MNCAYEKGLPHPCGKPAVAAVKVSLPSFKQIELNMTVAGLVVGACYLPVCYEHMQLFPDHDGIHLATPSIIIDR